MTLPENEREFFTYDSNEAGRWHLARLNGETITVRREGTNYTGKVKSIRVHPTENDKPERTVIALEVEQSEP